ncbi:AAA family ATPase, partial [Cellulomonas septica]|nr:AAA family ATPase [Cellulomonas septica]
MIEEIRIDNLGVITRAHVELGPGLTVLTGETGAGKTMVLTALSLLLGGKADPATVRRGARRHRSARAARDRVRRDRARPGRPPPPGPPPPPLAVRDRP